MYFWVALFLCGLVMCTVVLILLNVTPSQRYSTELPETSACSFVLPPRRDRGDLALVVTSDGSECQK